MSIPDEKLARWTALSRPGSPGPWMHNPYRTDVVWVNRGVAEFVCDCSGSDHEGKDSEAIAALPEMREAIDELVAEVRRLREALEWVKENVRGRAWFVANAALSGTPSHEMSTKWEPRGFYIECSCGWRSHPSENLDTAEQDAHIHAVETGEGAP